MTTIQGDIAGAALNAAVTMGAQAGLMSGLMSVALGQMMAGQVQPSGQGSIDLGDGDTLTFDKANSQMQII